SARSRRGALSDPIADWMRGQEPVRQSPGLQAARARQGPTSSGGMSPYGPATAQPGGILPAVIRPPVVRPSVVQLPAIRIRCPPALGLVRARVPLCPAAAEGGGSPGDASIGRRESISVIITSSSIG